MSIVILILGFVTIAVGYAWYAKTIDRNIIQPDDKKATPARMYMDGVDFTPANRNVLFGYQFKSIAALGPIVGPIVAVQYGWLPALAWIILGTFFIGWVQDYASIMLGVREEGQSFGALSYRLISPRSRMILLTFIYFYLWLIMGAFGVQVGFNLLTNPAVPLGVIIVILAGILAGQMTYKWKQDIILTSVVTVVISFLGILLGTSEPVRAFWAGLYGTAGGATSPTLFLDVTVAKFIGSLLVVIICYFGAVLPIWRWAQPVNYVAFWIVLLGVIGGVVGLAIWHPGLGDFPAFTSFNVAGLGPLWPILFVTIACGAISGWHSLVSSSGTARQLEKEGDALFVGGGSMFLEMFFAIMAFLTATVAWGSYQGYLDAGGGARAAAVFANGLAAFMSHWGLPTAFGAAYGMVFLCLMALTIMYLVVRFMRVASAEALGDRFPALKNVHVGSIIALALTLALIWLVPFLQIWVVFGAANQLMASLALLLITLWLMSKGKAYQWTFWPFVFMFVTTIAALLYKAYESFFINLPNAAAQANPGQFTTAQIIIGLVSLVLVGAAFILAWDGIQAIRRYRTEAPKPAKA
ncbi:MAG: carbon starvation CstA family protein [Anaerolineae bacterium]|jgi:carbon starvation protein|nr:carbon starvation CstA family protein [Anaerolineae bacterium]